MPEGFVTADTATKLPPEAAGGVVVCGSHGGLYPGYLLAKGGARAAILCDAGIGFEEAGIASLRYFDDLGIPAAAVSHRSCRIGDVADMLARGRLSRANALAGALGLFEGQGVKEAAEALAAAPERSQRAAPPVGEGRVELASGARRIILIDSAAMVRPEDAGAIVVTGSHGGLVGGDPAMALRTEGFAGVFNDAGIGADEAGLARLPALEARGIAGLAVSAASCRIGDARSAFEIGVISAANPTAQRLGATPGAVLKPLLLRWVESGAE